MIYEAWTTAGVERRVYRFRRLRALVRRLGGDHYQRVHDSMWRSPHVELLILRGPTIRQQRRGVEGSNAVCVVRMRRETYEAVIEESE